MSIAAHEMSWGFIQLWVVPVAWIQSSEVVFCERLRFFHGGNVLEEHGFHQAELKIGLPSMLKLEADIRKGEEDGQNHTTSEHVILPLVILNIGDEQKDGQTH